MCAALAELGHELRLFGKADRRGLWQGHPLHGAGAHRIVPRTAAFAGTALVAAVRYRPDRIISTHLNFGPAARIASRLTGAPFTLVAHGIDVHGRLPRATLAALRAAGRIVAVSAWTRQRVIDLGGIAAAGVAVLANTVDDRRFCVGEKPAGLAGRYGIGADEKVILGVARLDASERYKGYDRTIEALAQVRAACGPVRFLLVGNGDDRARIAALSRDHGVEHAVTFAGFVRDEELAGHYRLADVFAMPSTGEGFGIVFLEAMACGTPVLGGNLDGSVDALDNGRLGRLVDPRDVGAIADGLISLLRREGPAWWFERETLHAAVVAQFGRAAFRQKLSSVLCL